MLRCSPNEGPGLHVEEPERIRDRVISKEAAGPAFQPREGLPPLPVTNGKVRQNKTPDRMKLGEVQRFPVTLKQVESGQHLPTIRLNDRQSIEHPHHGTKDLTP